MRWKDKEVNTSGTYARVWWPDHPEATRSGLLGVHRAIGHDLLGRKLEPGEVVSCVDGNKLNFDPSNWVVRKHGLSKGGVCSKCGATTDLVIKDGLPISLCRLCRNKASRKYYASKKGSINERKRRIRKTDRVMSVLTDARKSDRRKGFDVDQNIDYGTVEQLLRKPCAYCLEDKLQMTLDRIDNALGHTKLNVIPACIRCNLMRRSMPYAAWVLVAEGVRRAREAGLFGSWTGQIHKSGE